MITKFWFACNVLWNVALCPYVDPTDIHLRHSLANLVDCALGTHERTKSSHLWTLAFAPETLKGTYLAGCMVMFMQQCV